MNRELKHFYVGLLMTGLFNFSSCKEGDNLQTCGDQLIAASITIEDEADFNDYHLLEKGEATYSTEITETQKAGDKVEYILHVELNDICNADKIGISIRFNSKMTQLDGAISASLEELGSQANFNELDMTQNDKEWTYSGSYKFEAILGILPGHIRVNLSFYFPSTGSRDLDNKLFYNNMVEMAVSIAAHKAI